MHTATHGAAKLIALESGNVGREEVAGVELIVANEFKEIAVQSLSAGFRDEGHDATGGKAGISTVVGTGDAEFLNGVDSGEGESFTGGGVVIVETIEQEVVLDVLGTDDVHTPAARGEVGTLRHIGHTGNGKTKRAKVAPVERKVDDLFFHDDLANRTIGGVDERDVGFDGDGFADAGDLELEIDAADLVDEERDTGLAGFGEAGSFDGNFVGAGRQQGRFVVTIVVGGGGTGLAVAGVVNNDIGGGNGRTSGTGYGADEAAGGALGERGHGEREARQYPVKRMGVAVWLCCRHMV